MKRGEQFRKALMARAEEVLGYTPTIEGLADEAGVAPNTIQGWFTKGRAPELGTMVSVADRLELSLPEILDMWQGQPSALAVTIERQAREIADLERRVQDLAEARHDEAFANTVAAAVALAVRTTLQAAGFSPEPPPA